jgi:hypothetical protein
MPYGLKHDREKAALSIQMKYKGWKGRKNFLNVRQHVIKLQVLICFKFFYYLGLKVLLLLFVANTRGSFGKSRNSFGRVIILEE